MNVHEIERKCLEKEQELMDKYYGNLIHEAAVERPETIGDYTPDLPKKIESEYFHYLKDMWEGENPDTAEFFVNLRNRRPISTLLTEADQTRLQSAYDDARRITLWERITKSNHEDVTYYKGLLQVYTKELLDCLRVIFVEEINKA